MKQTTDLLSPDVIEFVQYYNYAYGVACETCANVPLGAVQYVTANNDFSMNILPRVINELLDVLGECSELRAKLPALFQEKLFEIE